MKKFLLLTLIMCLFGGLSSSLMAQQFNLTYNQGAANQYTLTFTPTSDNECYVQMNKGNAPGANTDLVIPATVENNGKTYKVVSIPDNAFSGASSYINTASDYFTSLTIPNTVVSIGSSAFNYWSNCTTVILGEGVTSISNNAFANSSSITTIYCYADTPPTCGGNAVFHSTVRNNAKVYVPANSLNEYKKEATSGYGWAYININNFYAMSSTPALPDAPTLTSPTNGATGIFNPSLDFTLSSNTAQYQIFLAEAAGTGAGAYTPLTSLVDKTNNTVSYQTSNLKPNTTYYWYVEATNDVGSAESAKYSFTTSNFGAPGIPTLVYPENNATIAENPNLSWTFGDYTEQYQVLLGTDSDNLDVVQDWTSTLATSYQTNNLAVGDYFWKIVVKNDVGETSSEVFKFTKLGAPDNVTPISPADGATGVTSAIVRFSFAPNTTEYRLLYSNTTTDEMGYISVNNGGTGSTWTSTGGATEMEFTMPYYGSGKTFYWAVDVKNGSGQRTVWNGGEEIAIYSFTTSSISAPKYTSPSIFEGTEATLTWQYQEGEITEYQVLLGTDSENLEVAKDWTAIEGTSGSYTHSGLTENVKYYWQVNVHNNNESANGNVESFISLKKPSFVNNVINVYPGSNTEASANIQFNGMPSSIGAESYNIYVNEEFKANVKSTNIYTLSNINYNEGNPYVVKATAVYSEFGESLGSDINVYVSGYASVAGTVEGKLGNAIEGATIQYVGTTALEADVEKTFTFTTDANGQYSGDLPCGTYSATVSANKYEGATIAEKTFNYNDNITENVTLTPIIPGNVTNVYPKNNADNVSNVATLSWVFAENTNTTHYRVVVNETYRTGWIPTDNATSASFETASLGLKANDIVTWCVEVKNEMGARTCLTNGDATTITTYVERHTYTVSSVVAAVYTSPANNEIINDNVVTLEWSYGQGNTAEQYRVMMNKDGEEELVDVTGWVDRETEGTGFASTSSWTSGELTPTTKYNWRVDVQKGETIVEGNVSSFITPLAIPTNLTAENDKVYPTEGIYEKGIVKFSWTGIDGAIGYNVYRDGEYVTTTPETKFELLLAPRLDSDYEIQVTAVYDLGESEKTEAITVRVMGYATVKGTISNENGTLENATVTFTGVDAFGTEQTITFTTNAYGAYNGLIPQGTYTMTVSCTDYSDYTKENIKVDYNGTYTQDATLYTRHLFDVLIRQDKDVKFNSIDIRLTNDNWDLNADYSGTYYVYYQKAVGEIGEILSVPSYFYIDYQPTLLLAGDAQFRTIWTSLPNGEYRIGVSTKSDGTGINWCDNTITRDYCIFATDGRWEDVENWSNGEMPKAGGSAFIYAHATINSEIVAGTITIERKGTDGKSSTLTINKGGALIATDVINTANFACFVINDGGQLRRTNPDKNFELNGKFVMNITNPTEWTDKNKTGWQLISVPFSTDANISEFTDVNDRYDFYKFDGNNQYEEWINFKDTTNVDLETSFKQGRGYLVSYKAYNTFSPTGVFNPSSSHDFDITTGDKRMSGFQLLGNPFSFNMEWSKVEHSDLVDGFAVVNESGTYNYYDGSNGTIPVGDGFFVKAIGENPTMHYDANSRSRSEQIESINVIASSNKGNDNVIISFAGADKEGFPKLDNFNDKVANIFVNNNDIRYGIFNYDRNTTEVELSFLASVMGRYTISMKANGEFDNLVLVDRFTGIETNMLLEDYSFTASGQQDHNRFVVRLSMNNNDVQEERFVYQSGNELIINGEGFVQIIDIMGRIVYTNDIQGESRIDANNFYSATYVVRVVNENEVKTQKIVIY